MQASAHAQAGACALEGGSVRKRRVAESEEGNASTDEDSSESEEGGGSSEEDGSDSEGGGVAAMMGKARRGVAAQRVEGSKRTWSTVLA
eukprot:268952-Pelagomonas_calceolata.AAC.3